MAFLELVFHFLYTYCVAVDIFSFTLDEFAQSFPDKVKSHLWSTFTYWIFVCYFSIWITFKLPFVGFFFSLYIPFMIPCYLENRMWPFSSFLYLMLKQSFLMDIFPHIRAYLAIFLHYFIFRWDYCMLNYHAKTYDWLFLSWFPFPLCLLCCSWYMLLHSWWVCLIISWQG